MLNFVYDSLETLKKVKTPSKKEVVNTTIAVFVTIIVASIFFILVDGGASSLYDLFYNVMSK